MRYAVRHEWMWIETFFMPTNRFFARPNTSFNLENALSIAHRFPYSGSFGVADFL
jgi:hypothetical protein